PGRRRLARAALGRLAVATAVPPARRGPGGPWARWAAAVLACRVPVVAAWLALPGVSEVPDGFPAALLWEFRVASLGTQLVFWAAFGALFGWASDRARRPAPVAAPA